MKHNLARDLKVGGLIFVGLFIIFVGFLLIGREEGILTKTYTLYAKFKDVGGLTAGSPVRLGGLKVGTVSDIEFSPEIDQRILVVTMSIDAKSFSRIREDSRARIGSMGLLGDKTVEITVGSPSAKPLLPGEFVQTESRVGLEDILKETEPAVEGIGATAKIAGQIMEKINSGEGSLAKILNDPRLYSNLDSLLILWSRLTQKIESGEGSIASLVNDTVFYANLTGFLEQMQTFVGRINSDSGSLGKFINEDDIYRRTDSALIALNETLRKINDGQGTLGQLVSNTELHQQIYATLAAMDSLLTDFREHPKKYFKFSIF